MAKHVHLLQGLSLAKLRRNSSTGRSRGVHRGVLGASTDTPTPVNRCDRVVYAMPVLHCEPQIENIFFQRTLAPCASGDHGIFARE